MPCVALPDSHDKDPEKRHAGPVYPWRLFDGERRAGTKPEGEIRRP